MRDCFAFHVNHQEVTGAAVLFKHLTPPPQSHYPFSMYLPVLLSHRVKPDPSSDCSRGADTSELHQLYFWYQN